MDIPPKMGLETRRPEDPRRMYSTFVASRDFWREEGMGMANGMVIAGIGDRSYRELINGHKKEVIVR